MRRHLLLTIAMTAGTVTTTVIAVLARKGATWGSTPDERARHLVGDDTFGPDAVRTTNAITVDAPAETVWPWIVQIGRGRGGFYTYTWVERMVGADIRNLDHIEPAFQVLRVGDPVWLTPQTYLGRPGHAWTVTEVVPGRALALVQRPPDNPLPATWTLQLEPDAGNVTRLLSRHCSPRPATVAVRLVSTFWAAGEFVMVRGMLRGIKRRAEAVQGGNRQPVDS